MTDDSVDLVLFRLYLVDGAELDGADPAAIDQLGPEVIEVAGFEQVPDRRRLLLQFIDDDKLSTQLPLFRRKLVLRRHESRLCRGQIGLRSEEHTSELQSQFHLVCRLLL